MNPLNRESLRYCEATISARAYNPPEQIVYSCTGGRGGKRIGPALPLRRLSLFKGFKNLKEVIMLVVKCENRHYGFFNFLFDCFMICLTFGFWIVYIFVREMRKR